MVKSRFHYKFPRALVYFFFLSNSVNDPDTWDIGIKQFDTVIEVCPIKNASKIPILEL